MKKKKIPVCFHIIYKNICIYFSISVLMRAHNQLQFMLPDHYNVFQVMVAAMKATVDSLETITIGDEFSK